MAFAYRKNVTVFFSCGQVSAAIVFDAGVLSCLEYLEAAPWAEDEEETSARSRLHENTDEVVGLGDELN